MPTVYIETSIVSYLRSQLSSQTVVAARQLLTRRWWDHERHQCDAVTSQYVLTEAADGSPELAEQRLRWLDDIPLLDVPDDIPLLAEELLKRTSLPSKARIDALHIATAAYHEIDYLLTWNCAHIANFRILPQIRTVLVSLGHAVPTICTPEEMLGDEQVTE